MRSLERFALLVVAAAVVSPPTFGDDWPDAARAEQIIQQADARLEGFTLSGQIATYTRANLAQLIGAAADRIFAYDYQWTVAATLTAGDFRLAVHLYRFGTDLDSFGAFSVDRDPKVAGELISLDRPTPPVAAYWNGNQLHVWRGPLYLRIVPADARPALRDEAVKVARLVLTALPPAATPASFAVLPPRGLVTEATKYQRAKVLGQSALTSALTGCYGRRTPKGLEVDLEFALFVAPDAALATATYDAVAAYLGAGGGVTPVAALGDAAFSVRHATRGTSYAMRQGRYTVALTQVKDRPTAEALLREIGKNIRSGK